MSFILLPEIRLFDYEDDLIGFPIYHINKNYIDRLLIGYKYKVVYDIFAYPSHFYLDNTYNGLTLLNRRISNK